MALTRYTGPNGAGEIIMTNNEWPSEIPTDVGKITEQSMEQVSTDVRKMKPAGVPR
jgi:hypothetical protein